MIYEKTRNRISLFKKNYRLIRAVKKGNINEVTRLIEDGANVNTRDIWGNTHLILAVNSRDAKLDVVEKLIASGADVNKRNIWANPLLCACWGSNRRHYEQELIVDKIIDSGGDVDAKDIFGRTPLMIAAIKGRYDCMFEWRYLGKKLIDKGACQEMRKVPFWERFSQGKRLTVEGFNGFIASVKRGPIYDLQGNLIQDEEAPSTSSVHDKGIKDEITKPREEDSLSVSSRRNSVDSIEQESKNGKNKGKEPVCLL